MSVLPRLLHSFVPIVILLVSNLGGIGQTLIHTENFGSSTPTGWTTTSLASADNWTLTSTSTPCEGSYGARLSANSCAQDDWIFSKSFSCTKDYRYSITFKADNTANLDVYAGNAQTTTAMTLGTNMLSVSSDYNCANVSTTTYFTASNTGTYYFAFRVRGNCSSAKLDNIRFYELAPIVHTWNGNVDNDWSNESNWSNGIPTNTGLAVIPSSLTNYPNVDNEVAVCKTLTIDNGAMLTVSSTNPTDYLQVYGDVSINGTLNFTGSTAIKLQGAAANIAFDGSVSTSTKLYFENGSSYTLSSGITCEDITIASGGSLSISDSQILQTTSFSNSGVFTLGNNAILKITGGSFLFEGTNNLTNGTVVFSPVSGNITIPNLTYSNLNIITTNGATITVGDAVVITGDLSIANLGAAGGIVATSGDITVNGNFNIGVSDNAFTLNLYHRINAGGTFTMGNNSDLVLNISYTSSSFPAISASNSSSMVFYGSVNYNASSDDQIIMQYTYNGPATCSNNGLRYMSGDLDFNDNLTISGGSFYAGTPNTLTIGSGSGTDNNQKAELSPYQGQKKSARWQIILNAGSDLVSPLGVDDVLKSISFFVTSKASENAFENFTIKMGHTSSTKFANSSPSYFLNDATTTVFNSASVITNSGWNTHIFDNTFTWDGVQNILVDIAWDNTASGVYPDNAQTSPDAVSYTPGVFGADHLIRVEGNTSQVAATDGTNSDDITYNVFNFIDGPYDINISQNWQNTNGTFYHMNNTVTFDGSSNQNIASLSAGGVNTFYNLSFNNTSTGATLQDDAVVENVASLNDGVISTGSHTLVIQNPSAGSLTGYSNQSFVNGNLRRFISTNTSTYGFPLGNGNGSSNYYLNEIINNNLAGTSYLDATFVTGAPSGYEQSEFTAEGILVSGAGVSSFNLNSVDATGYFQIDPDFQPSSGTYSMKIYNPNYAINQWEDNKVVIIKRNTGDNSISGFSVAGTVPTDGTSGRMIADGYIYSTGISNFSIFVPGSGGATPLPVNLLAFYGKAFGSQSHLFWTTSSELNNDYFLVERVQNNKRELIAKVNGAGNSNQILNYRCIDKNPHIGSNYYQLTQVDFDGTISKSEIISVNINDTKQTEIFPNPASSELKIHINADLEIFRISLFDMIGKEVYSLTPSGGINTQTYTIDISRFARGIYTLTIANEDTLITTEKIIIK